MIFNKYFLFFCFRETFSPNKSNDTVIDSDQEKNLFHPQSSPEPSNTTRDTADNKILTKNEGEELEDESVKCIYNPDESVAAAELEWSTIIVGRIYLVSSYKERIRIINIIFSRVN